MWQPNIVRACSHPWLVTMVYGGSLAMHVINSYYLLRQFEPNLMRDPQIEWFYNRMLRFLTIWNVCAQMLYLALGLSCQVMEQMIERKASGLLKTLTGVRDSLFACIVWPHTWLVFTVFWPFFLYDRRLVLPPAIDPVLSRASNHVIHSAILPIVIWAAIVKPMRAPKSHFFNLSLLSGYTLCYLFVIIYTYFEDGRWLYPVMTMMTGTIYLYLFIGGSAIAIIVYYFAQWPLYRLIGVDSQVKID